MGNKIGHVEIKQRIVHGLTSFLLIYESFPWTRHARYSAKLKASLNNKTEFWINTNFIVHPDDVKAVVDAFEKQKDYTLYYSHLTLLKHLIKRYPDYPYFNRYFHVYIEQIRIQKFIVETMAKELISNRYLKLETNSPTDQDFNLPIIYENPSIEKPTELDLIRRLTNHRYKGKPLFYQLEEGKFYYKWSINNNKGVFAPIMFIIHFLVNENHLTFDKTVLKNYFERYIHEIGTIKNLDDYSTPKNWNPTQLNRAFAAIREALNSSEQKRVTEIQTKGWI